MQNIAIQLITWETTIMENKILRYLLGAISIFLLTLSLRNYANEDDFSVILEYTTNIKYQKKFTLEGRDQKIILNGMVLPSEKIMLSKNKISFLVLNTELTNFSIGGCPAGIYKLTVIRNLKNHIEDGCIGTERFSKILTTFKAI